MPFLTTTKFYTPELLRSHSDKYFVFGDNTRRQGHGGQAAIRDEPNALGIATKFAPNNVQAAFFKDNATSFAVLKHELQVVSVIARTQTVVLPVTADGLLNIGTGLSAMPTRCPQLFHEMQRWFLRQTIEGNLR